MVQAHFARDGFELGFKCSYGQLRRESSGRLLRSMGVAFIGSTVMDEKMQLINMWKTQNVKRNWSHYIRGLNAFNSRFIKEHGERYAESFFVVPAKEYIKLCKTFFEGKDK